MKEYPAKLKKALCRFSILFALVLLCIGTAAAGNNNNNNESTVYSNIPNPVPLNVFSTGAQAYSFVQFGDGFNLAGKVGGTLDQVTVVMQSWACESGGAFNGPGPTACVSTTNATYPVPVTVYIYSVTSSGTSLEGTAAPAPLTLIGTATQTFNMPYRPSSDFVNCPASASVSGGYYEWYDANTQTCQDGIDFPITFNLASLKLKLPSEIIVTFSYNTTSYGPSPLGTGTACFSSASGCFYDSLNVTGGALAAAYPGPVFAPSVGSVLDVSGIYTSFANANTAFCGAGTLPAATLALDASPGCYTGNHPMIEVTATQSESSGHH